MLREDNFDDLIQFGPKQLVSSTKLVRNLSSYINMVQKAPVFVERDQEVQAVLISVDDYRNLLKEEEKGEELYHFVLSLRRKYEHLESEQNDLTTSEMLKALNLTEDTLTEGGRRAK
jgi:PHD/YefM family antitoxin component YafN of YafNO toxin-antitoxin module